MLGGLHPRTPITWAEKSPSPQPPQQWFVDHTLDPPCLHSWIRHCLHPDQPVRRVDVIGPRRPLKLYYGLCILIQIIIFVQEKFEKYIIFSCDCMFVHYLQWWIWYNQTHLNVIFFLTCVKTIIFQKPFAKYMTLALCNKKAHHRSWHTAKCNMP